MTVNYTTLLQLPQPIDGTEAGTWGDVLNNAQAAYLDIAIAGGLAVTVTVADVTLAATQGTSSATNIGSTTSQYAILNVSGAMTAARNLIVPSTSKWYIINNTCSGGYTLTVKGAATTGVGIVNGEKAVIAWNGSDFVKIATISGAGVFSSITNTGLTSGRVVYSTTGGLETDSANLLFDGTTLTASSITSKAATALTLQSAGTTAVTVDTSQNATFAGYVNAPNTFGFKNRIINGAMVIAQRGTGTTTVTANGYYSCDRWNTLQNAASKYSVGQSSTAPAGFTKSLLLTSLSAYTVGAAEQFVVRQGIEGVNTADLGWGAAGAQTVTVSFWVRSSLTGSFGASLYNNTGDRSYPFSYTISAANTFEQKTITIPGDTAGTWVTDSSGAGIYVSFSLGSGSTYSGTANAWAAAYYVQPTGSTSLLATNGATLYITGVQLEKGSVPTSFDYRPYGTELVLCQRYYQATGNVSVSAYSTTGVLGFIFPVVMRASPTVTFSYNGTANNTYRIDTGAQQTLTSPSIVNTNNAINNMYAFTPAAWAGTPGTGFTISWFLNAEL